MPPHSPKILNSSMAEAHDYARSENEPLFVPATPFADDRGWSLMNLMQGVMSRDGQLNYSVMYPGVIKAWHRHQKQTDFWLAAQGHLKAGIHRESDNTSWLLVIGEKRPGVLIIPPTLWHGAATVGPESASLIYYVTHAFDPAAPDEDRRAYDSIAGFPWEVAHR